MKIFLEWLIRNCVRNSILKNLIKNLCNPPAVSENVNHKLIWDMNIQRNNVVVEKRPDIVIVNKMEKRTIIIDAAIPGDKIITVKEKEKIEKYQNLKGEILRFGTLRKLT